MWIVLAGTAQAWEVLDVDPYCWDTFPIVQTPDVGELEGAPAGTLVDALAQSQQAWSTADSCTSHVVFETAAEPVDQLYSFDLGDGLNGVSLGDPDDVLEPGVYAATLTRRTNDVLFAFEGRSIVAASESDIMLNDDVDWSVIDPLPFLLHEQGHVLGLGHSTDETSVMYFVEYETPPSALQPDDVDGLTALYTHGFQVDCSPYVGGPPHDVDCTLSSAFPEVQPQGVQWDFDDGSTGTGTSVSHTFAEAGEYYVEVCAQTPNCDSEWCDTAYVAVCRTPELATGVKATLDPLTVRLLNDTPIDAAGCFLDVEWTVRDAEGALVFAAELWEPVVTLPAPGVYEVTLEVRHALAEDLVAELTLDTSTLKPSQPLPEAHTAGCLGCSHGGGSLPWFAPALLLGLSARRRRDGAHPSR